MGLRELFGLRGARDKPTNSYNSGVSFLFGRSTSGISVNERTAMQTTAVYSCVRILAEAIASLPLHLYRYTDKGKELKGQIADLKELVAAYREGTIKERVE